MVNTDLFDDVQEFPDPEAGDRFDDLVGLDHIKRRLIDEARVLLDPSTLVDWSRAHYNVDVPAVRSVSDRVPLIVLAGDVGTGKTELAETVGHPIAVALGIDVTLYPLSLNARGVGLVGQMTTLITGALTQVRELAGRARRADGVLNRALILLVDEADSVAQSRELAQMHHEDRAGVNALIRGIDGFRRDQLPVLTILCTNRADALDPAVARRAAHVFTFTRPDLQQITAVLCAGLAGAQISEADVAQAAKHLAERSDRPYGATYSDLRHRFLPDVVLDAYGRDLPIDGARTTELAAAFEPTRPFGAAE